MESSQNSTPERPSPLAEKFAMGLKLLISYLLACFGGFITVIFALFLIGIIISRISGSHPTRVGIGAFILWFILGAVPLGLRRLLWREGNKTFSFRKASRTLKLVAGMVLLFLIVGADGEFGPNSWHRLFRRGKLPPNDARNLKATYISPHLVTAVTPGTNLLWCGTFQLAWNAACARAGGDLHFEQDPPTVAVLNRHEFTTNSLDPASYVALAGTVGENIFENIQNELKRKFQERFKPCGIPDKNLTPRPQDLVAYACLYKHLEFPVPFEKLDDALDFKGMKVRAFGMETYKEQHEQMYPQVLIYDYQNENDFVIGLKTKSEGDRIILAKIEPAETLAATVAKTLKRTTHNKVENAVTNDIFIFPRISFDLSREFNELENHPLNSASPNTTKGLSLLSAMQQTRFEMNEKGVELQSEAHISISCEAKGPGKSEHRMVFNKPFLVLLERDGAAMPYFALWIDNPELLIPW
jgi:Serpin (serine protease inhibitor)